MKSNLPKTNTVQKGFTLIELLVVIGILTILLSIVLIAINPSRQFSQANNTQRRSDINALLNAVHQYAADNNGTLPSGIPSGTASEISNSGVDICSDLAPTYIAELPADPTAGNWTDCSTYATSYNIVSNTAAGNRITVSAPSAELDETISVTR